MTCLIAKVEAQRPQSFHLGVHLLENRFQFLRHVQALTVSAQG